MIESKRKQSKKTADGLIVNNEIKS